MLLEGQGNTRVSVTCALPVNRHHSSNLYASTGVFTRTGSNVNTGGIAWQFRWGGGLSRTAGRSLPLQPSSVGLSAEGGLEAVVAV
jgi:hypothetical protein